MGVTAIKRLDNRSGSTVTLVNVENPRAPGSGQAVPPGGRLAMDNWIPWAGSGDFASKHLQVRYDGATRFWIWQALNADGDHVRFSVDGRWYDRGEPVDGISAPDGNRTLIVFDQGVQLVDLPEGLVTVLRAVLGGDRYRLDRSQRLAATSVPRLTASTFSVAGPASDTKVPTYRDTGKRYEFRIEGGVVEAIHPDGRREPLTRAVSYDERRTGVKGTAPPFDQIAAGGGRLLAKARDDDRFYFLAMDETFVHKRPTRTFIVPSTYFKLDPEANAPGANPDDLTRPISGAFGQHPAAERFPLFRMLLAEGLADMMMVAVETRVWHLVDARPPVGINNLVAAALGALADQIAPLLSAPVPGPVVQLLGTVKGELDRLAASGREADIRPPQRYPTYEHVVHRAQGGGEMKLHSIQFRRVLDTGIGHVNWHEQYSGITGGEIQPMLHFEPWATLYRFVAGPIRDGDGYIDGTCNFYALVELGDPGGAPAGYALLYQDEQSYFTQRWRAVDPDDSKGLMFAVVTDLAMPWWGFDSAKYWSPFKAGVIGPASRLAVAAQVLLVTGDARAEPQRRRIYSTNFSWSTIDRSWRWRELPAWLEVRHFDAAGEAAGTEPIAAVARDTVYPQTIRLREDMTVNLKGTRARPGQPAEVGRWYQRYLPSANRPVPAPEALVAGGPPATGYSHPWKFLPEEAWSRADRYSHLGVYDTVDSRAQFYEVTPSGDADARALAEAGAGGWLDHEFKLSRWAPKLSWSAPGHILTPTNLVPGVLDRRPASLYNRETRLRIVFRNGRWIAMHWDKRDDELLPLLAFDNVPAPVTLSSGSRLATVTLHSHRWLAEPPAVQRAEFRWSGEPGDPASVTLWPPPERPDLASTLWRLRIAALPAGPIHVLDVKPHGALVPAGGGAVQYRWTPSDAQAASLRAHCTAADAPRSATSLWVENIVGQVAVPDEVAWIRTAPMTLVVDRAFGVPEASAGVDTGIDLLPGDDFALEGSGQIKSGVLFTSWNGPEGWTNVDHDPKFPLHEGPDARPFALIARLAGLPWFYVGAQRARAPYVDGSRRRLQLRTNDDSPGNGEGAFTCRVRVWRELERSARCVAHAVPARVAAGQSVDVEIRMRNTGRETWTPQAGFRLGAVDAGWQPARVELSGPVPTAGEAVFRFRATAPGTAGLRDASWRMLKEGVEWFGEASPAVAVTVSGAPVVFGAKVRLRHVVTRVALHSHPATYGHPRSSGQQQVTGFAGADSNDFWRIKPQHGQPDGARGWAPVRHGDVIRLEHLNTRRNLHSHGGIPSPVTGQQEVTAYGTAGTGDANDDWRVEVDGGGEWTAGTRLRLIHVATNHALHSHAGAAHPQWTLDQQEVTGFGGRDDNDLWTADELRDAQPVSCSVPQAMVAGQTYAVEVRMRNTGTAPWSAAAGHRLGSQAPADTTRWGPTRVALPVATVAPGAEAVFAFTVTPTATGRQLFSWQMVQEGVEWYGAFSPAVEVSVSSPGEPAECATLRARRLELLDTLADLDSQLADMPRAATRIRAMIAAAQRELATVEQRARELGCAL